MRACGTVCVWCVCVWRVCVRSCVRARTRVCVCVCVLKLLVRVLAYCFVVSGFVTDVQYLLHVCLVGLSLMIIHTLMALL